MRVLIATDGSACADVAIDLVASIRWPHPPHIEVISAVASGVEVFGGPWPPVTPVDTTEFDAAIRGQAAGVLNAAAERLDAPDRSVTTLAVAGRPSGVITNAAEDRGSDLIVVGSRGHGAIETMVLGSVAAEVVDRAVVPALVARGKSLQTVLFAWDGSIGAEHAATFLIDSGICGDSAIHVLSVAGVDQSRWVDTSLIGETAATEAYAEAAESSRRQHEQLAREMAERLVGAGLDAVPLQREGDAATQIVRAATSLEADLVVVGTHGRTGLARLIMGSVARNVLLHAPCSVLVAHEKDRPR